MTEVELLADLYVQNDALFVNNKVTIESVKQAYIAGAIENSIVWHKVADGDLPEYGVEVLDENGNKVRYEMEGYAGDSGQFPSLSGWIAYSEYEERDVEIDAPVAWCEIPTFEEEA